MGDLKNKRVLLLGLGSLGGGVATAQWLLKEGARLTVSDLKTEAQLAGSVRRVEEHLKKVARDGKAYAKLRANLTWALGGHSNALIDAAQVVVVNPDVSVGNPYVRRAITKGKTIVNEGTLFYGAWKKKTVGITGTRGKTTTANWTHHLITGSVLTGNSTTKPFLSALGDRAAVAVTELSSFILELFPYAKRSPNVAVITNLYCDHLNRHRTMQDYAQAKANVFAYQKPGDWLILNAQDSWTPWFVAQKPKAKVRYFSLEPLPVGTPGIWHQDGQVYEQGKPEPVLLLEQFAHAWGMHNVANLLAAASAAHAAGVAWARIQGRLDSLPQVPYRQEVVFRSPKLTVVNDTTATSPEGGIAALQRWGGPNCILITGGTDRDLEYGAWANALAEHITKTNTVFLVGSATQKMKRALGRKRAQGIRTYDTLAAAWRTALKRSGLFVNSVVLFSPAAKSFELFQNEFDRGQQFNALVERDLKKGR